MTQLSNDQTKAVIEAIVAGQHHDPHSVLGAHPGPDGTIVRTLRPMATSAAVVLTAGRRFPMEHLHQGVFEATLPADAAPQDGTDRANGADGTDGTDRAAGTIPDYRIAATYPAPDGSNGPETITDDPYRHLPTLGEVDLHLIGEGRHEQLWKVLGAHPRRLAGVSGTAFAVWAPNARGVRVIGDFNYWDGRGHPMRSLGGTGVWELFVPGPGDGDRYKFEITGPDGARRAKADPMARAAECPPETASVVAASRYAWGDADWLEARSRREMTREPFSIYEVHLGSWRPGLSYRRLAEELTAYVTEMGFTHVELLPVAEHPFGGSWGYQVTSYYAPTARFGTPDDFRYLVDRLHQAGIGVILDWVPGHFPRDDWALANFDGTPLYEHADPRRGAHPEWGTLIFDFGRREVRNFLVANALYWMEEFHADGLRVDAVASMLYLDYSRKAGEWLPNSLGGRENLDAISLLQEVNATCYRRHPGITMIAEESTAWPGVTRPVHLGGLGFGFKWNMGWMHDTLDYLAHDPMYRGFHHNELTFSLIYAFSENYVLPLSHDEVVHGKGSLLGKMPGDDWRRFAGLRALLAFMWAHPGKQLLFMGSEFGQGAEWSEARGLDWWSLDDEMHRGVQQLTRDLNGVYGASPALWRLDSSPDGFAWIDANDSSGNVISFLRFAGGPAARGTAEPPAAPAPAPATSAEPAAAASAGPATQPARTPAPGAGNRVLACVANFAGVPHERYRIGLPHAGRWREAVNTDAAVYGGSGVGNLGVVTAVDEPCHGLPASATLTLPPLAVLWLTPED